MKYLSAHGRIIRLHLVLI